MLSTLINLIIILLIVGLIWWLIDRFIPTQGTVKQLINIVFGIIVIVCVLGALGIWGSIPHFVGIGFGMQGIA